MGKLSELLTNLEQSQKIIENDLRSWLNSEFKDPHVLVDLGVQYQANVLRINDLNCIKED
jgi:hypothetical protein